MDKIELVILSGLPASGKSTYARSWVEDDPTSNVRINRDDIRQMLGPYWVPSREGLVTKIEWESVIKSLKRGYNVILDATNFKLKEEHQVISKIKARGGEDLDFEEIDIIFKRIDTSFHECIRRDRVREDSVGDEVICNFYNKYLKKEGGKSAEELLKATKAT